MSKHIVGIGEYRVLSPKHYRSISEILLGVREIISRGVDLNPSFNHKHSDPVELGGNESKFEQEDLYYHSDTVNNDQEIRDAIKKRWEHIEYVRPETSEELKLDFGSKECLLEFCFNLIKSEMNAVNEYLPVSEEDIIHDRDMLKHDRKKSIISVCRDHRLRREYRENLERLVSDDNINGLAELEGELVLGQRIRGYGNRSECSWEDIKQRYGMSSKQLSRFRSSKPYHKALSDKCIEEALKYKQRLIEQDRDLSEWKPNDWWNSLIIRKSGAIDFVEPDYSEI